MIDYHSPYQELIKLIKETLEEDVDPELVEPGYVYAKAVVKTMNDAGYVIIPAEELHELVRKGLTCAE